MLKSLVVLLLYVFLLAPTYATEEGSAAQANEAQVGLVKESSSSATPAKKEAAQAFSSRSDDVVSSKWPLVLLSLVLILFLIFALGWITRRLGGFKSMGQNIQVLSTLPLGSRERVALIEVEGQKLVIGVTSQQITMLHALDSSNESATSKSESPDQAVPQTDFVQTLKSVVSRQNQ